MTIKLKPLVTEAIKSKFQLNIIPGDIVLGGKFRNKPYTVASFGKDKNGQPIIITDTGKEVSFLSVRIKKLMPKKGKDND